MHEIERQRKTVTFFRWTENKFSSILTRLEQGRLEQSKSNFYLFIQIEKPQTNSKWENAFPSMSVKPEFKWATPVGSSTAWNMVSNPMAPCLLKRYFSRIFPLFTMWFNRACLKSSVSLIPSCFQEIFLLKILQKK